jgi:para-nitrobenzyl esterase
VPALAAWLLTLCLPGPEVRAATVAVETAPVVEANGETLHGEWGGPDGRIAAFRGIPFAAAPVGELRWRAPRAHEPRRGAQSAREFAAACMQGSGTVDWYAGIADAFGHDATVVERPRDISEDCLYLNVWTPDASPEAGLPVLLFVHGGRNASGWSYEPNYRGGSLAARGAVVVTVAYRLGLFGFFSHPALGSGTNGPVANFGLLDVRASLAWVQRHIRAFGGDPDNITAIGESSGALNLADLLLAEIGREPPGVPPADRLILQSLGGSLVHRQSLAEEQALGRAVVAAAGLEGEATADRLRGIPAGDLLRAAERLPEGHFFDAVVDGRSLPDQPMELLRRARAAGIELLVGTNADEWFMYLPPGSERDDVENWAAANFPGREDEVLAIVAHETEPLEALDVLHTGRNELCYSRFLARRINETGGRAWNYYFNHRRPGAGGESLRVYHGAELPYVFDSHDPWLPTTGTDRELTSTIIGYWLRFARTGDPGGGGGPAWPRHTADNPAVMELGGRAGLVEPFPEGICRLLGPEARYAERDG